MEAPVIFVFEGWKLELKYTNLIVFIRITMSSKSMRVANITNTSSLTFMDAIVSGRSLVISEAWIVFFEFIKLSFNPIWKGF